ncbi:hypothetical protein Hanom_Chr07g00610581 [Helianthus anomalus]
MVYCSRKGSCWSLKARYGFERFLQVYVLGTIRQKIAKLNWDIHFGGKYTVRILVIAVDADALA